ncbi:MAG: glycosyltransferase family 2 protein [Candidatus Fermentibacteraceae bacterium]|nr:glycosyltransferase family 2 protein [Candidatus Fermentibacteraceae bacterium]
MLKVAVVLVNYGQWELTRKCIDSLMRSEGVDIRVTLVDNHSEGEVPAWINNCTGVRFERLNENTGFAGGNNIGFQISRNDQAEFTLFLNNDALIAPGAILKLAEFLVDNPEAGIVTPPVYYASDPERIWSAGGRFIPWKMRFDQKVYPSRNDLPAQAVKLDFASGCAMMIRTELFERTGGFRDDFFMYYEDADLCRKVSLAGYSIWLLPAEEVVHHVASGSGGELSPLAVYFSERNRLILSRQMLASGMRAVFLIYISAVLIVKTFKFLIWQGPRLIPWIWKGYVSGLSGRTGYRTILKKMIG